LLWKCAGAYRYGFNGKESDDELGTQDYGMRIYNASLCRFLSVDPMSKDYPELAPYQFASNTPIQAADLDGLEMYYAADGSFIGQVGTGTEIRIVYDSYITKAYGLISLQNEQGASSPGFEVMSNDLYNSGSAAAYTSTDELGLEWARTYNAASIVENREHHSFIFITKVGGQSVFSYTEPTAGDVSQSGGAFKNSGAKHLIGDIHTHGGYDPNYQNDIFSMEFTKGGVTYPGDIDNYIDLNFNVAYLATPNGSFQKYMASLGIATLRTDLPSDPKDPVPAKTSPESNSVMHLYMETSFDFSKVKEKIVPEAEAEPPKAAAEE